MGNLIYPSIPSQAIYARTHLLGELQHEGAQLQEVVAREAAAPHARGRRWVPGYIFIIFVVCKNMYLHSKHNKNHNKGPPLARSPEPGAVGVGGEEGLAAVLPHVGLLEVGALRREGVEAEEPVLCGFGRGWGGLIDWVVDA